MKKRMILNMDTHGNIAEYRSSLNSEKMIQMAKDMEKAKAAQMQQASFLNAQMEKAKKQKNVVSLFKNKDTLMFKENLSIYLAVGIMVVAFFVLKTRK